MPRPWTAVLKDVRRLVIVSSLSSLTAGRLNDGCGLRGLCKFLLSTWRVIAGLNILLRGKPAWNGNNRKLESFQCEKSQSQ